MILARLLVFVCLATAINSETFLQQLFNSTRFLVTKIDKCQLTLEDSTGWSKATVCPSFYHRLTYPSVDGCGERAWSHLILAPDRRGPPALFIVYGRERRLLASLHKLSPRHTFPLSETKTHNLANSSVMVHMPGAYRLEYVKGTIFNSHSNEVYVLYVIPDRKRLTFAAYYMDYKSETDMKFDPMHTFEAHSRWSLDAGEWIEDPYTTEIYHTEFTSAGETRVYRYPMEKLQLNLKNGINGDHVVTYPEKRRISVFNGAIFSHAMNAKSRTLTYTLQSVRKMDLQTICSTSFTNSYRPEETNALDVVLQPDYCYLLESSEKAECLDEWDAWMERVETTEPTTEEEGSSALLYWLLGLLLLLLLLLGLLCVYAFWLRRNADYEDDESVPGDLPPPRSQASPQAGSKDALLTRVDVQSGVRAVDDDGDVVLQSANITVDSWSRNNYYY